MVDHLSKKKRSWNMSRIRFKDTKPEITVRKFLCEKGFRYRLHTKSLPGKPDISNKSKRIAIFVNGCFWHQHPGCNRSTSPKSNIKYWTKKLDRNVELQKENLNLLSEMGYRTFVLWECEVSNLRKLNMLIKFIK